MGKTRRILKGILADPSLKRELMIRLIIATQAREGIETTWEQAERAHDAAVNQLQGGVVDDYA